LKFWVFINTLKRHLRVTPMKRGIKPENCPLRLLANVADKIPRKLQTIEVLDDRVREYFEAQYSNPSVLRKKIFLQLSPFLLKLLSNYCHFSKGCGVNCLVSELLSSAYIEFDDLINDFDFDRQLNFTGYIVNGLAWRIFNEFAKERHYGEHHVLVGEQMNNMCSEGWKMENRRLSSIELRNLLSKLWPSRRRLILLHDLFGYTCAELGAIQKIKPETVQKRIVRAKKKMLALSKSESCKHSIARYHREVE